jgi:hypothetical protein
LDLTTGKRTVVAPPRRDTLAGGRGVMDGQRFDVFTRTMAAGVSRRTLVAGLAGGVLAALGRQSMAGAADSLPPQKRPHRLRRLERCNKRNTTSCGIACCAPGYECLEEAGCAPAGAVACGGGYCDVGVECCDDRCGPCHCDEGTVQCGGTCVDNQCAEDEFFDFDGCECLPKREVFEECSGETPEGNAQCLSDVCGCANGGCVCRNFDCAPVDGDCTNSGTPGCCTGFCVGVTPPFTCVAVP